MDCFLKQLQDDFVKVLKLKCGSVLAVLDLNSYPKAAMVTILKLKFVFLRLAFIAG